MRAQAQAAVETMGIIRSRKQDQSDTRKRGKTAPLPGGARPTPQAGAVALRPDFAEVQQQFETLLQAFTLGKFDQTEFTTRLSSLRLTTEDGADWTIGVRTRLWYRREQGSTKWDVRQPPTVDSELPGAIEVTSFDEELQRAMAEPGADEDAPGEIVITQGYDEDGLDELDDEDAEEAAPAAQGGSPNWDALDALLAEEDEEDEEARPEAAGDDHLAAVEMLHGSGQELEGEQRETESGGYDDLLDAHEDDAHEDDAHEDDAHEDEPVAASGGYDDFGDLDEPETEDAPAATGESSGYGGYDELDDLDELEIEDSTAAREDSDETDGVASEHAEGEAGFEHGGPGEPTGQPAPAISERAASPSKSSPEGEDPLNEALDQLAALISRMSSTSRR